MKRSITFAFGAALVLTLAGIPLFAQTAPKTQQDRLNKRADRIENRTQRAPQGTDKNATVQEAREKRDAAVSKRLEFNDQLRSKLGTLVPSGTTLNEAATGFKTQSQFISALYASKNLGIPFADLKAKMTGPNPMTLAGAIQVLKPETNSNGEASKAENQATALMK